MAAYKTTASLNKTCRKYKINFQQKVYADLLIMGWDMMDAYALAGLFNSAKTLDSNYHDATQLKDTNAALISYYNARVKELNADAEAKVEAAKSAVIDRNASEKYRDKDELITALAQVADELRGKDRADVLNKIADMQRMKQEENKEEEKRVHFYLPQKDIVS